MIANESIRKRQKEDGPISLWNFPHGSEEVVYDYITTSTAEKQFLATSNPRSAPRPLPSSTVLPLHSHLPRSPHVHSQTPLQLSTTSPPLRDAAGVCNHKEVEGEVGASVVHSPWNAPHGFLTPMAENLDKIQPSGAAYATESSFLGSRTLSCVPDEQLSESLSVNNYAAATDVEENYNGSDPGPETEYVSDVSIISALDIFYTFLGYLTQRQLQLVCGKFELSKCGTKE
jgi:hypothetical protein